MAKVQLSEGSGESSMQEGQAQIAQFQKRCSDSIFDVQKELMSAYEEASRAWVARVKSEVEMWSELAAKLSATRSIPEGMETYAHCVSKRMQMPADGGRRLFEEAQKIMGTVTRSAPPTWFGQRK